MIYCPTCGAPVPDTSINQALGAARCPECKRLFEPGASTAVAKRPAASARPAAVPVPEGWVLDDSGGALEVRWRWPKVAALFLIPFTVFWNFVLVMMGGGFAFGGHPERLLFGLFVPHVWVGIGLVYYTIAMLVNTTAVRCAQGALTVRHFPLPWFGRKTMEVRDLRQLFVVERRASKGGISYELCALLDQDRMVTVLKGLDSADKARFLEVRLEQALEITDAPVAGEVPK
jgi:DNA-directed RNA polymerase subunit RPC12/RpoP